MNPSSNGIAATRPDETMPRPRTISREHSLDRAITVFWNHGYRATTMEMLADALGVAKPSVYAIFGSKKQLFRDALARYHEMFMARLSNDLEKGSSLRDGLNKLMCELMAPSKAGTRRGCLASNMAMEMAVLDSDIEVLVNEFFQDMHGLLTRAIRHGQETGEIRKDRPAAELAQFLLSSVEGVRVLEKTDAELSHWTEAACLTLSVLDRAMVTRDRPSPSESTRVPTSAGRKKISRERFQRTSSARHGHDHVF